MIRRAIARVERTPPLRIGVIFLVLTLLLGVALFQKNRIGATLKLGNSVQADFARDFRLRPYVTKVKVAGVPVGVVTGVDPDDGRARVAMKLDRGIADKLGSSPSAAIRPVTLLGGNYYVELRPGGDPGAFRGVVPRERTTTPVELDHVLEVLKPTARKSTQLTVRRLDATLDTEGRDALKELLADAPAALHPAGTVLQSLRGTDPDQDLTRLVSGLESTARVLTERRGLLDGIVADLRTTTTALDKNRRPIAQAIGDLPATLRTARAGLTRLDATLVKLRGTADAARPIAVELDEFLAGAEPMITKSRPLVHGLRPLLADARPVVQGLVPTALQADGVLDDLRGPVLQRVNGPIMRTVLSPYKGTGQYKGSGSDTPFYQELGYLLAAVNATSKMTDRNGATVHFQPGVGAGSLAGTPISFEQLLQRLLDFRETQP